MQENIVLSDNNRSKTESFPIKGSLIHATENFYLQWRLFNRTCHEFRKSAEF